SKQLDMFTIICVYRTYEKWREIMGKRCLDADCPHFAHDGTCLRSENELKDKCPARERIGHEPKDEWIFENFKKERLKSLYILQ
ncbi:MAG: hypothetical protein ACETVN_01685, partial [Asgard group archaeon]